MLGRGFVTILLNVPKKIISSRRDFTSKLLYKSKWLVEALYVTIHNSLNCEQEAQLQCSTNRTQFDEHCGQTETAQLSVTKSIVIDAIPFLPEVVSTTS